MTNDEVTQRPSPRDPGERLTEPDWTSGVEVESGGSMRMAISNAVVGLKKRYYGKGPTRAQTYINDNYVFAVLEGGLTRNEETLLEAGEEDLVRNYRLAFQEAMAKPTIEAIEQVTGRRVIGYHSQIVFRPERAFEIFVLDEPPGRV
jgi:uncharacterized protein YbcI